MIFFLTGALPIPSRLFSWLHYYWRRLPNGSFLPGRLPGSGGGSCLVSTYSHISLLIHLMRMAPAGWNHSAMPVFHSMFCLLRIHSFHFGRLLHSFSCWSPIPVIIKENWPGSGGSGAALYISSTPFPARSRWIVM